MKKTKTLFASLAAAGLLTASGVVTAEPAMSQNQQAQPAADMAGKQGQQLSEQDKKFIMKAAENNTAEIWMARLALKRGTGEPVKQFANEMIKDHEKVDKAMKSTLEDMGLKAPAMAIRAPQMEKYEELATVSRDEFDATYMNMQVKAHKKTLKLFEQQAEQGQAQPLVKFAEQRIPTLNDHLQEAQRLVEQM